MNPGSPPGSPGWESASSSYPHLDAHLLMPAYVVIDGFSASETASKIPKLVTKTKKMVSFKNTSDAIPPKATGLPPPMCIKNISTRQGNRASGGHIPIPKGDAAGEKHLKALRGRPRNQVECLEVIEEE